jgi:hypothetical protein
VVTVESEAAVTANVIPSRRVLNNKKNTIVVVHYERFQIIKWSTESNFELRG